MIISGYLSRINFSKIRLEIEVPDEIYAKTEFIMKARLVNQKRFMPAFLIRATILDNEILFPIVERKNSGVGYAPFQFGERGKFTIGQIRLCSVFPFNFFMKCCEIKKDIDVIVFPQMKKCDHLPYFEKDRRMSGDRDTMRHGFDSEPIFIRDYIEGDPLKYIHWKATAKTGKLKTKELSSQSLKPVIIDFKSFGEIDTEKKISCITYIINTSVKRGVPVGLRINGDFFKEGISRQHKINMLRALALYGK